MCVLEMLWDGLQRAGPFERASAGAGRQAGASGEFSALAERQRTFAGGLPIDQAML